MTTKMTKNITENINKTGIITKKITSLFIPICLLLISFSLVNCPDPGNGNGNGGGQTEVPVEAKPQGFATIRGGLDYVALDELSIPK